MFDDLHPALGGLLFWGLVLCVIMLFMGSPLIFLGILVAVGIALFVDGKRQDAKREEERRRSIARPCVHGVEGAVHEPTRCGTCRARLQEEADRKAEMERRSHIAFQEAQRRALEARKREYAEHLKSIRTVEYLRKMPPRDFELMVCELYRRGGYSVESTPYTGDEGIDGVLRRDGLTVLLQCKRVQQGVGQPVVRDLFGCVMAAKADGGVLVTTGHASQQAKAWASDKPIKIVEVEQLKRMITKVFPDGDPVPKDFGERIEA